MVLTGWEPQFKQNGPLSSLTFSSAISQILNYWTRNRQGQGGNFGSEKSDRRRQIFRSAGIWSAEPSNFVGKIGESAKSADRQNRRIIENRQIGKIGISEKLADRQNRRIVENRQIGEIGGSEKSADRQNQRIGENQQIGKIGGLGEIGVGSGIGRHGLDFFVGSARPIFFRNCHPGQGILFLITSRKC